MPPAAQADSLGPWIYVKLVRLYERCFVGRRLCLDVIQNKGISCYFALLSLAFALPLPYLLTSLRAGNVGLDAVYFRDLLST